MPDNTSLPPHLERFVHELIATGRFHSEGEVIRAALQLLEASSVADTPSGSRRRGTATSSPRPSARPAKAGRWESPGDWLAGSPEKEAVPSPARRSPRGLLADLRSGISPDDIDAARSEMWAGLRPGEAG